MKKEIVVPVVGLSHYMDDYDEFCKRLVRDSFVFVKHEQSNKYDEYALIVTMPDGRIVGYISGKCSHQVYAGIGEKMVMGIVISGEHKSFDIRMMVDAEAYDNAQISTDSNEIKSQLAEGVIGLRNVLPTLHDDIMMDQAWAMIEMGREMDDDTLVREGVLLFSQYLGCSLCAEDMMRGKWILEQKMDMDDRIFTRLKDMGIKEFVHESILHQLNNLANLDKPQMDDFRKRYANACTGDSKVRNWLDTVLDGQLRGCYDSLTEDMACFILYHKLSRIDIYTLLSHIIAVKKIENKEEEVEVDMDETSRLKAKLISRISLLTPYLYNMEKETFVAKLNDMFDINIQDSYTDARHALWRLFTEKYPRDKKEGGLDRIVTMNLVGKIKDNKYFKDNDDALARVIFKTKTTESDGNNIGRAFEAQRYTTEIHALVNYYFP